MNKQQDQDNSFIAEALPAFISEAQEQIEMLEQLLLQLEDAPDWTIEVHDLRPRPAGSASAHHVDDLVLRARRAD